MNRPLRTAWPLLVTSVTSITPRAVETSTRRPALVASISYLRTPLPESTTTSTRSPLIARSLLPGSDVASRETMPAVDLPAPLARFLDVAYADGVPEIETAVLEGSGRFRRRPLPWIRFGNTISLRLGGDRVSDMFVRLGPITLFRVLDAFVDGHGITRFLNTADLGGEIDQGALHPMLVETLMFPSSWSRIPGLAWDGAEGSVARVSVPFAGGTEVATVGFDPRTGYPTSYEAPRFKAIGGPKVDWRVDMADWSRFGPVVACRRIVVTWADDPGPWLKMRFAKITTGEDVAGALARARAAISEARRKQTG